MISRKGVKRLAGDTSLAEGTLVHKVQRSQISPQWDKLRRELTVDGQVVKCFRLPAPNQIAVLAAFEEEDWPPRVLDPLQPQGDHDPKRRLHETIKALNRHHHLKILRFRGDGTGQGVLWEWITD